MQKQYKEKSKSPIILKSNIPIQNNYLKKNTPNFHILIVYSYYSCYLYSIKIYHHAYKVLNRRHIKEFILLCYFKFTLNSVPFIPQGRSYSMLVQVCDIRGLSTQWE